MAPDHVANHGVARFFNNDINITNILDIHKSVLRDKIV
jgi:hypothetical protein